MLKGAFAGGAHERAVAGTMVFGPPLILAITPDLRDDLP